MAGLKDLFRGAGLLVAAVMAAVLAAGPAARAEGAVFAGVQAGDVQNAYLGVSVPLPGARIGEGLAVRGIVGGGKYRYGASLGEVHGRDIRADASLLYQVSNAHNYFDVGVGARYIDTRLTPHDPANPREGRHWEAVVSASGQQNYGPWAASEFGSYGTFGRDYFVRGDLTHKVYGPVRLGIEAETDGARDYSRRSVGGVIAFSVANWEVRLSGGATDQSHRSGGYGGATFRASF